MVLNVKFVIVGDGRDKDNFLKQISDNQVQDMFIMVDRQPPERIPELLAACDAAFLSFQNDSLWRKTIPAKLQTYMACGMPIIAAAEGETERVVNEAVCGVCSPIGSEKGLCTAIHRMMGLNLQQMSENSRRYFEEQFEKQKLMNWMEQQFFQKIS